ncbi:MAG TPA: M24 family metallopeptidase [Stellaceae bacterium]|nr:M24 family metallopeptidase [Stellaceae bacterium]
MRVLHTTLLTGPYDWEQAVLPREEFAGRLAHVRAALGDAAALFVHGHAGDYGDLNYLTGFTPKLGPALAMVPVEGDIRLLVGGTDLMIPQAKRLTWVEDVRPFANVPKAVADWLGAKKGAPLATWGFGSLAHGIHRGITAAVGPLTPLDAGLDPIRRRKSPREMGLMRRASVVLGDAVSAFVAAAGRGAGARTAALAAEKTAIAADAQDARTLVSVSPGGAPLPLDGAEDQALDPLLATIAVQVSGYWAAGYVTMTAHGGAAHDRARAALDAMVETARAGVTGGALRQEAARRIAPFGFHPALGGTIGNAIGLSLDEGPLADDVALERGATYALRVGAAGEGGDAALVSAMIAVGDAGASVLWTSPRP